MQREHEEQVAENVGGSRGHRKEHVPRAEVTADRASTVAVEHPPQQHHGDGRDAEARPDDRPESVGRGGRVDQDDEAREKCGRDRRKQWPLQAGPNAVDRGPVGHEQNGDEPEREARTAQRGDRVAHDDAHEHEQTRADDGEHGARDAHGPDSEGAVGNRKPAAAEQARGEAEPEARPAGRAGHDEREHQGDDDGRGAGDGHDDREGQTPSSNAAHDVAHGNEERVDEDVDERHANTFAPRELAAEPARESPRSAYRARGGPPRPVRLRT